MEVSYNGSPSYLTQGFSGVAGGASYYYTSYRSYAQESSIDIVRSLHDQLIGSARAVRETNYTDFQSSVVPYDVVLRYRMKDGGEVVRYYRQASIGELSAMLALDNDAHTHELENAVVTGETSGLSDDERAALSESPSYNAYRAGSIYVGDGALNRIMAVECTDEERAALLQALAADLADLNANERYLPSKPTRVALMFTLSPELDVASFGYSFSNAVSYVTDDWTRTMAWLEGKGLVEALGTALDSRVIEQLTFQLDDPYASINKVTQPVSRYSWRIALRRRAVLDHAGLRRAQGGGRAGQDRGHRAEPAHGLLHDGRLPRAGEAARHRGVRVLLPAGRARAVVSVKEAVHD